VVLQPEGITRSLLYGVLSASEFMRNLASRAGGTSTSHQRVKPHDLLNTAVVTPAESIIDRFSRIADPIYSLTENLRQKSDNLRSTRDLLLPRLISGEIDVAAMEEELAGAAA
jgi:type I restriction enzyme, S subunit